MSSFSIFVVQVLSCTPGLYHCTCLVWVFIESVSGVINLFNFSSLVLLILLLYYINVLLDRSESALLKTQVPNRVTAHGLHGAWDRGCLRDYAPSWIHWAHGGIFVGVFGDVLLRKVSVLADIVLKPDGTIWKSSALEDHLPELALPLQVSLILVHLLLPVELL